MWLMRRPADADRTRRSNAATRRATPIEDRTIEPIPRDLPRWPIAVGVVAVAVWGVALRGLWAGLWTVPGNFAHLRHAHSHGGVYLIVFPLCVLAWRELGIITLGHRLLVAYYTAGAVSILTFSLGGYSALSIGASTLVAVGWLTAAYRGRAMLLQQTGALRLMPIVFVLVTAFITPIALLTPRDPQFATELAHSFLATLFLLVAVPVALRRIGAAHLDARIYAPSALVTAGYLGAWPAPIAAIGLVGVAGSLTWTLFRSPIDRVHRVAWTGFVIGSMTLALTGPVSHHTTIGGLHYLLLGPLFMSLVPLYGVVAWCTLACATVMAGSLSGVSMLVAPLAHTIAAGAGVAWAVAATVGLVKMWRSNANHSKRSLERVRGQGSSKPDGGG